MSLGAKDRRSLKPVASGADRWQFPICEVGSEDEPRLAVVAQGLEMFGAGNGHPLTRRIVGVDIEQGGKMRVFCPRPAEIVPSLGRERPDRGLILLGVSSTQIRQCDTVRRQELPHPSRNRPAGPARPLGPQHPR